MRCHTSIMEDNIIEVNNQVLNIVRTNTVIVGTGAAGYNAADRLYQYGQKNIIIVTENRLGGTSRNTGSDKQTYFKISLSGDDSDSVRAVAETLFNGHGVDGDLALCEAALSAQSFYRLVELGVPFPHNRYGEYVGYKTDHDLRCRASSVGPYTSKVMTECLEKAVLEKGIDIYDNLQVIKVLVHNNELFGLLCLNTKAQTECERYFAFNCTNVVFATGGPSGIYADSVYPEGHFGATGLAFEAGVKGVNLTEWQYGLASIKPRWNVSGTYMQAMPRFISYAYDGSDEREFLSEYFDNSSEMNSLIFLKGYQWPFDVRKIRDGSSIIDLLVYRERFVRKRRVFLDFMRNTGGEPIKFSSLRDEVHTYLSKAGACFGTPIERLFRMNKPAVDLYLDHGIDLRNKELEITLSAQHNNGGLLVDCWWQTNLNGFFAVGEIAGTHGVYRPGGSALNAGQVGSTRAAMMIAARRRNDPPSNAQFLSAVKTMIAETIEVPRRAARIDSNVESKMTAAVNRMSLVGAAIRDVEGIRKAIAELWSEINNFSVHVGAHYPDEASQLFRLRELLVAQIVYFEAMSEYVRRGGKSRGSALYTDPSGELPSTHLPDLFKFKLDDQKLRDMVMEITYNEDKIISAWRKVRPIPNTDDFFENIWREYRENQNIF